MPPSRTASWRIDYGLDSIGPLSGFIEDTLKARIVELHPDRPQLSARASQLTLPGGQLWSCAYRLPIKLRFLESDYLRVQVQRVGTGMTDSAGGQVAVTSDTGCISHAAAVIDFAADFEQFAWRVTPDTIVRKLAALTGNPAIKRPRFDTALDLSSPTGANFKRTLDALLAVAATQDAAASLLIAELEQAALVALLCAAGHNYSDVLARRVAGAAPWQVRRAEAYIEANWDKPLTIEDIVEATDASARSLFRTFKETRGYSPVDFVRQVRLRQARRVLEQGGPDLTVTKIALASGYGDLAQFSKEFSRAFGETPSAVLRRTRHTKGQGS